MCVCVGGGVPIKTRLESFIKPINLHFVYACFARHQFTSSEMAARHAWSGDTGLVALMKALGLESRVHGADGTDMRLVNPTLPWVVHPTVTVVLCTG